MRYLFLSLCLGALLLGGCAGGPPPLPPEPVIQTKEVNVAVPVPCAALAKLGEEPSYADTDTALAAAPDIFESTRLLLKGRLQRIKRGAEYIAARTACTF